MQKEIKQGEYFSLASHYQSKEDSLLSNQMVHAVQLSDDSPIAITGSYVAGKCKSASYFEEIVHVGYENKYWTKKQVTDWIQNENLTETAIEEGWTDDDWFNTINDTPRVGDLKLKGIKSIFEDIRDQSVFTVFFYKVDKKKTKKEYNAEIESRVQKFMEPVIKAKTSKKSMEDAAREAVMDLIENPVLDYHPGELRQMICYKEQFSSKDGRYKVFDLEAKETRLVNLPKVQTIIYDKVKYERI